LKRDGTRAETRFCLSMKRTSPFKLAGGGGPFSRLLAAEVCASPVVMVVMLDTPCSEVECKTTAEMVPRIPSCHYMLLMQLSRLKSSSSQLHVLFTCKITTATG